MDLAFVDIVAKRLEQLKADIQQNMADKNINASGRTSASLKVKKTRYSASLVIGGDDTAPAETLEVGIGPGVWVPFGKLFQWSIDKGIEVDDRNSFAWGARWNIHQYGTIRHTMHKDVYSTLIEECIEDITTATTADIKQYIVNQLK